MELKLYIEVKTTIVFLQKLILEEGRVTTRTGKRLILKKVNI
jgi:hypothetical protein